MRSMIKEGLKDLVALGVISAAALVGSRQIMNFVNECSSFVENAPVEEIVFTGDISIDGYFRREDIPDRYRNSHTRGEYLQRILELNSDIVRFEQIPYGKKIILPNLDNK